MRKLLQQLVGESAIYGLSGMAAKIIGVFLMPLYTQVLTPSDYGELNLVNNTFFFISLFVVFGLDNSAARWYYDTEDRTERKKTITAWFSFQLLFSVFLCVLLVFFSSSISSLIVDSDNYLLFVIPALGLLANVVPSILTNLLRFQRKSRQTVIFTLIISLFNVSLNILFVLFLKIGVIGILLSALISNATGTIYGYFILKDWVDLSLFSWKRLKDMLIFAYPLVPTVLAMWVLNSMSSYIIGTYCGKHDVGLFQVGITISSAISLIVGAFQMAWGPFAFSIHKKPEAKRTYSLVLTLYTALTSFLSLAVGLFAKELLEVFTTPDYYEAAFVIGILSFNNMATGLMYIANIGPSIAKTNKPIAVAIFIGAGISVVLFFMLIPSIGIVGAAIGTLTGTMLIPVYVFYKAQKMWHVPYKFGLVFFIILFAMSLFLGFKLLEENPIIFYLKISALLLFAVTVYFSVRLFGQNTTKKSSL